MSIERWGAVTDTELAGALAQLADEVTWPATPDVATSVTAAVHEHESSRRPLPLPRLSMPSRRRAIILVAAALLLLAGAVLAARLVFHLGAISVEVIPDRPTGLPSAVLTDDLGRELSLEDAGRVAGFAPSLPSALGPPAHVWVDEAVVSFEPTVVANRTVAAWNPSPELPKIPRTAAGAILMQFEGDAEVARKQIGEETNRFGTARVNGSEAFWTGGPHTLELVTGDETDVVMVTGNVLIWQEGAFTFRLETKLPKNDAVAIAESIRVGEHD